QIAPVTEGETLFQRENLLHDREDDGVTFFAHGSWRSKPTADRHMPNFYPLLQPRKLYQLLCFVHPLVDANRTFEDTPFFPIVPCSSASAITCVSLGAAEP